MSKAMSAESDLPLLRNRRRPIAHGALIAILWPLFGLLYLLVLSTERPLGATAETLFLSLGWLEAGLLAPWIVARAARYPFWTSDGESFVGRHLRFGVIVVFSEVLVNNLVLRLAGGRLYGSGIPLEAALALSLPTSLLYGSVIYAVTLLVASAYCATVASARQRVRSSELRRDAARLGLDLFRLSINPSLVTAALRRIEKTIDHDAGLAERATHLLADFLRSTLDQTAAGRGDRLDGEARVTAEVSLLREYLLLLAFTEGVELREVVMTGESLLVPAGILRAGFACLTGVVVHGDIELEVHAAATEESVSIALVLRGLTAAAPSATHPAGMAILAEALTGTSVRIEMVLGKRGAGDEP
jgi:hypothetical protein